VLPQDESAKTRLVNWQTLLPLFLLIPISLLSVNTANASVASCAGVLLLCGGFLYYGVQFVIRKSNASARHLLTASIIYVPSIFVAMILLRT